jgi:hypothetical protein
MIVTSAKYGNENKTMIDATIDGQEMFVPLDPANRHYAAILEWVDAGNTIAAAD